MADRMAPGSRERRSVWRPPTAVWTQATAVALVLAALCPALLGLVTRSPACAAAGKPSFAIQPESGQPASEIGLGYFTVTMQAGQQRNAPITVKNLGTAALALFAYATDGVEMSAGGIGYDPGNRRRSSWVPG